MATSSDLTRLSDRIIWPDLQRPQPKATKATASTASTSVASKIVNIAGRVLTQSDIGKYIVRPQITYNQHGRPDQSMYPMQGKDCFSDVKLVGFGEDKNLLVETESEGKKSTKVAWFYNDGNWITVEEFKSHMKKTGEILPPLKGVPRFGI